MVFFCAQVTIKLYHPLAEEQEVSVLYASIHHFSTIFLHSSIKKRTMSKNSGVNATQQTLIKLKVGLGERIDQVLQICLRGFSKAV